MPAKEVEVRRKPDLLRVLIMVFCVGVVATGYTHGYLEQSEPAQLRLP